LITLRFVILRIIKKFYYNYTLKKISNSKTQVLFSG
jgi:hypothetical protein